MRLFGHRRLLKDETGTVTGEMDSPVKAKTRGELDGSFGCERGKALIVSLEAGDLITLRPVKARADRAVRISAFDVYRWAIQAMARARGREKAKIKREKKAMRLANARQRRAEKKLIAPYES